MISALFKFAARSIVAFVGLVFVAALMIILLIAGLVQFLQAITG